MVVRFDGSTLFWDFITYVYTHTCTHTGHTCMHMCLVQTYMVAHTAAILCIACLQFAFCLKFLQLMLRLHRLINCQENKAKDIKLPLSNEYLVDICPIVDL